MANAQKPNLPPESPAREPARPVFGSPARKPTGHRKHGK